MTSPYVWVAEQSFGYPDDAFRALGAFVHIVKSGIILVRRYVRRALLIYGFVPAVRVGYVRYHVALVEGAERSVGSAFAATYVQTVNERKNEHVFIVVRAYARAASDVRFGVFVVVICVNGIARTVGFVISGRFGIVFKRNFSARTRNGVVERGVCVFVASKVSYRRHYREKYRKYRRYYSGRFHFPSPFT